MENNRMQEKDYIPNSPQERILAAVLSMLELKDPGSMTSRAIAKAAGVNVAAINYYYRSKEALIEAALISSWNHTLEHINTYLNTDLWEDPRTALKDLGQFLLEGGSKYPVVSRTMFFDGKGNPRRSMGNEIADVTKKFAEKLEQVFPLAGRQQLLSRFGAFVAALILPALVPESQPWLGTEAERSNYLSVLIDDFLEGTRR